jgi:hypothetical protein
MWTRITSLEQLRSISAGTLMIKHMAGNTDKLDVEDKEKLSVRYVLKNMTSMEQFDLSLIPYQMEHFVYMLTGLRNLSFASIHKKYSDIIADGSYWIFNAGKLT